MTISQTPILRDADAAKNAYRGFAMAQMRILKDYMKTAGLNTYSRVVTLANGVVITCKVCGSREDVFLSIPVETVGVSKDIISVNGFICHPRTGEITNIFYMNEVPPAAAVIGGFAYDKERKLQKTSTRYIYPLDASDNACCVVHYKKDSQHVVVLGQKAEYGNFYLINPKDKTDIISWKGTPSRQVPLNQLYHSIPGVDSTNETIAFTPNIYKQGKVWLKGPKCNEYHNAMSGYENEYGLILGCGYHDNTLLAVVKYDIKATILARATIDRSKPYGTYISLWEKTDGWRELCRVKDNTYSYRPRPWSFSVDGLSAVNINGDKFVVAVADSVRSAIFVALPNGVNVDGDEKRMGATSSKSTGDGITSFSNDSEYHTLIEFKNQKESKFFGYSKDSLLSMDISIDELVISDDKISYSHNEYYDMETKTKCKWTTSGPIYMQCNDNTCCNATLKFVSPNGEKECLAPDCTSGGTLIFKTYTYSYQSEKTTIVSIPGSGIPDRVTVDKSTPISGSYTVTGTNGYWQCVNMSCVGDCQPMTIQVLPSYCDSNIDPTPKTDAVCAGNTKTYIWGNTDNAYYVVVTCAWVCL